jgi:RHS repeat-associated protein
MRAASIAFSLVASILFALDGGTPARAIDAAYLAAEAPDVVTTGRIAAQAQALNHDPVRIYEFVRNEFEFEPYYGLMKGPEATLRSRAGNDYDLAALLVSLLRSSNIPARFARGRARFPLSSATEWTGSTDPVAYFKEAEPVGWRPFPTTLGATSSSNHLEILHIWAEAYVPLGSYRGAEGNQSLSSRGQAWVPLDPSFKLRRWNRSAPTLPIGQSGLQFDELAYLSTVQNRLPLEVFEDQVRAHLAASPPNGPPRSVDQVMLGGEIIRESAGFLPTGLPFEVNQTKPLARHASLVPLHDSMSPGDQAGDQGAPDYRYQRQIHLCKNNTNPPYCDQVEAGDPKKLLEVKEWSAAWSGKRVTIWFPPTAASVPRLKPEGYAASNCGGTNGTNIFTIPTVSVEGAEASASEEEIELCKPMLGALKIVGPLGTTSIHVPSYFQIEAGDVFLAGFDEGGSSDSEVEQEAFLLSIYLAFNPLAHDDVMDLAFIDSDKDGVKDASESYLPARPEIEELLTGQLLHLAHTWHWNRSRKDEKRIVALHRMLTRPTPATDIVSSGRDVEYLFDVPFGVQPSNLRIDVNKTGLWYVSLEGERLENALSHVFRLAAHHASAMEHAVWEEIARVNAVSTVQGLQLAQDMAALDPDSKVEMLSIESFDEAKAEVQARCNATNCNGGATKGLDILTYCFIYMSFPRDPAHPNQNLPSPTGWRQACPDPWDTEGTQTDDTADLRILNRAVFEYPGFEGFVFARFFAGGAMMTVGPGSANGGVAVGTPLEPFGDSPESDIPALQYDERATNPVSSHSTAVYGGDPVSVTHGSYFESHADVQIPGPGGMDLRFVRSYNSRLDTQGMLGHGWTTTFDQHLREDDGTPTAGDETVVWLTEEAVEIVWTRESNGVLTPEPSNHHQLVKNANNTYTLTTVGGMKYDFLAPVSKIARLLRITDRNNNAITVFWSSGQVNYVTDATGRVLDFAHQSLGTGPPYPASVTITDWTGRDWSYHISNGQLDTYTDPEGHEWTYEYYLNQINPELDFNIKKFARPATRNGDRYEMWFYYYDNDTVSSHIDPLGRETRFAYNYFRKRTDVFGPDGAVESYHFDKHMNVTKFVSAEGHVTAYGYSNPANRNRTKEVDAFGRTTTLGYDAKGNVTFRLGRVAFSQDLWTYNDYARPLVYTDARGNKFELVYDATGWNVIEEYADLNDTDRVLLRKHWYDPRGNRTETAEYFDAVRNPRTYFDYDPVSRFLVRVRAPLNAVTRITPDPLGRPVRVETDRTVGSGGSQTVETLVVTREFDNLGRVIRTTDAGGLVREVEYDPNGLAAELRSIVEYGPYPSEVRIDQRFTYDVADRLVSTTNALDQVTQFTYDDRDRRTQIDSPMGRMLRTVYDLDGRAIQSIDPAGFSTTIDYDPLGRPIRVTDALGREATSTYDNEGRLLNASHAGRVDFKDTFYDGVGNLRQWSDAANVRTLQTFDELGRRITKRVGSATTDESFTQYQYDRQGRLLAKIDGNNHTTTVEYDDLGRATVVKDALIRARMTYAYDEVGNIVLTTDGAGKQVRREYDAMGRVTVEEDLSLNPTLKSEFQYDRRGRLIRSKNPNGTIETYAYDKLDRLTDRVDMLGAIERFVYDDDGQVRQQVQRSGVAAGTELVINYDYDDRGLLTAIRDPQAGTFEFEADAVGRTIRRTGPGGAEWRATYTSTGEVDLVEAAFESKTETTDYVTFDARGYPLTSVTSSFTGATQTSVENLEYRYTPIGRLDRVCRPNCAGTVLESYTYDDAGNRLTSTSETGPGRTYHYDAADQLTQITNTTTGAVLDSFGHDGAGRRTSWTASAVTTTYTYDGGGRLKSQARPGYSAALDYGASGGRIRRAEGSVVSEYPTPRAEVRGGTRYRILRSGAVGGVVAEVQGTNAFFLHPDASMNASNVTKTTSPTGSASAETAPRRWTAFGTPRNSVTSVIERGYASQPTEGATGLVYMGARHYDPATGRFLQPDPLWTQVDELYAYAGNNPYLFWDPTGLAMQSFATDAWNAFTRTVSHPLVAGSLQAIGGVAEAAVGGAACTTGIGCIVGAVAFTHGVDQAYAGLRTIYSGQLTASFTNQALQAAGIPAQYAGYADSAISVATGVGAGRAALGLGTGTTTGVASFADDVASGIPDSAFVVRGGVATEKQIAQGIGPHRDVPGLTGFSAQSRAGATVEELASRGGVGGGPFPHGQVSVTTAGKLRCLGCDVVSSPGAGANHVTVVPGRATPAEISDLFVPRPNPARRP